MDFHISTIEEALAQPIDSIVNITVAVLKCSDMQSYTNKDKAERKYFSVQVADATTHTYVRCYLIR